MVCTRDHIISGLCEQGYVVEGMEWLITMLKSNLKPQKETFYKLIQSLIQIGKLDDSLSIIGSMFRVGYKLEEGALSHLLDKLCENKYHFVESKLEEIINSN